MRRCCCRATAARGVTIPVQAIIATSTRSSTAIGADPDATMYALRHSSIVRMLLQNVPIRLVASLHNTSVAMIERTYSKYITEHSDGVSRKALLQLPVGDTVAALAS